MADLRQNARAVLLPRLLHRLFQVLCVSALLAFAGCATTKEEKLDYKPVLVRIFVEAGGDLAGMPVQLPLSGSQIYVSPKPVYGEFDILSAELVRVDIGMCLYFQLTPDATRDFYRFSLQNRGRRIVISLNGAPVGAQLLDQPVSNGALFFFVELPDKDLPDYVQRINKTSRDAAKQAKKAGKR